MSYSAVSLIDPYWLLGYSAAPTPEMLSAIREAVRPALRLERIYWYLEGAPAQGNGTDDPRLVRRVCVGDELDDGYSLLREIDRDLAGFATARRVDAIFLASLDDRLALSVERAKSAGLMMFGCRFPGREHEDDAAERMVALFDQMIGVIELARRNRHSGPVSSSPEMAGEESRSAEAIDASISQWLDEADVERVQDARELLRSRRHLPKFVDSRLLYLTSRALGRELLEPEKHALRREFKQRVFRRGGEGG